MKFLKYLLFAIIALAIIFFGIGLLHPSVSYGHEITVNKSNKESWAVSKDPAKFSQWLEGFQSIELISGEQDKVGSKYKVIVNPGDGQPDFEMIETIVSMKEFEHVELLFESDMMNFEHKVSHAPVGNKSTVKSESKVMAKGLMMKSMFALMEMMGGTFQAQETKNMEALKKLIEANTTDYYPAPVVTEEESEELEK